MVDISRFVFVGSISVNVSDKKHLKISGHQQNEALRLCYWWHRPPNQTMLPVFRFVDVSIVTISCQRNKILCLLVTIVSVFRQCVGRFTRTGRMAIPQSSMMISVLRRVFGALLTIAYLGEYMWHTVVCRQHIDFGVFSQNSSRGNRAAACFVQCVGMFLRHLGPTFLYPE